MCHLSQARDPSDQRFDQSQALHEIGAKNQNVLWGYPPFERERLCLSIGPDGYKLSRTWQSCFGAKSAKIWAQESKRIFW